MLIVTPKKGEEKKEMIIRVVSRLKNTKEKYKGKYKGVKRA